jgi:hypothetical protein
MENVMKEAAGLGVCAICGLRFDEEAFYFSIGEHEKAICWDCVKEMCPSGRVGHILEAGGIKIEWQLVS